MSIAVSVTYEPDGSPSVSMKDRRLSLLVSRLQSGEDLCREVYEQVKGELKNSFEEYLLFWPEQKVWILPDKQLGLSRIKPGAQLEFKPRKRTVKIRFLDASSKRICIDETSTVQEIARDLGLQLRLEHPEELSFVVAGDYAITKHHPAKKLTRVASAGSPPTGTRRSTLGKKDLKSVDSSPSLSPGLRRRQLIVRPGSASKKRSSSAKVKKQISKKHQIRLETPWLDPSKTLAEQEVTESNELILMFRFYYHMELEGGSTKMEMLYKQARATYLAGELLCSPNDMVRLSAILCQIAKGDYMMHKYSTDFLVQMKNLIAPPKCKIKTVAKKIIAEHSALKGLSVNDAKCWFIKLWSSLELFGMEFLSCTNTDTKDKGLIGVSKDRIMFWFHKKKKNICWDIETLVQWIHDSSKDTVTLNFSHDKGPEVLNLHLPEYSGVLVDCLQGHRNLSVSIPDIARSFKEYQFNEDLESAISGFAAQAKLDAKGRRALTSLTYEDVYWAGKIENPLLSDEELAALKSDSWENPAFENMDQLMSERFNFLDFTEYTDSSSSDASALSSNTATSSSTSLTIIRSSPESSPNPSPRLQPRKSSDGTTPSPLTSQRRSADSSPCGSHRNDYSAAKTKLTNGLLDSYFKGGHSRSASSGSSSQSEGGASPKPPNIVQGKQRPASYVS